LNRFAHFEMWNTLLFQAVFMVPFLLFFRRTRCLLLFPKLRESLRTPLLNARRTPAKRGTLRHKITVEVFRNYNAYENDFIMHMRITSKIQKF
jgi:hypothetical protein